MAKPSPSPTDKYSSPGLSNLSNVSDIIKELKGEGDSSKLSSVASSFGLGEDGSMPGSVSFGNVNTDDTSEGNLLSMIFNIVPIGINIASRGKTMATGLKESSTSVVKLITNMASAIPVTGLNSIEIVGHLFASGLSSIVCSVKIFYNFPHCVVFYFIDILSIIILVSFFSSLFIIDLLFFIKLIFGTSLTEVFFLILEMMENIDSTIYKQTYTHIIHYSEEIIQKCYKCDSSGDSTAFQDVKKRIFKNFTQDLPIGVIKPVGNFFTGIGHIFSFLDLG
jgi:hypothetical protein